MVPTAMPGHRAYPQREGGRIVRGIRISAIRQEGGFLYAAGIGIVGGTPLENIEAFLSECDRQTRGLNGTWIKIGVLPRLGQHAF